jgi:hypothetical protein
VIASSKKKKLNADMRYLFSDSLEKRVNKKVMAMFEKAEDEYNDLMSKKSIIEASTMSSLFNCLKIVDCNIFW